MPTHDEDARFRVDYARLTQGQRREFALAVRKFVEDLRIGRFRAGLRVKRVQIRPSVWEMTRADDGRATFEYGDPIRNGDPHIIWRRVGTHDIFRDP